MLAWMILAAIIGLGVAASSTMVGLFIVEFHPKSEWDERIGWLQTLYGTGQAAGLLLAAIFGEHANLALYLAALMMLPGFYFGLKKLPHKNSQRAHIRSQAHAVWHPMQLRPHSIVNILNNFHRLRWSGLRKLADKTHSIFSFYIVTVFLIMLSVWLVFNLYPLLMLHAFNIHAGLSSLYYGIGATIGIFAYPFSGSLAKRIGDLPVLLIGVIMVAISWLGMSYLAYFSVPYHALLIPAFFMLTPIAWSPLIVVGTSMAPKLSNLSNGEAIGIFNATIAIASFFGALLAGCVAELLGYSTVILLAAVIIIAGMICVLVLRRTIMVH